MPGSAQLELKTGHKHSSRLGIGIKRCACAIADRITVVLLVEDVVGRQGNRPIPPLTRQFQVKQVVVGGAKVQVACVNFAVAVGVYLGLNGVVSEVVNGCGLKSGFSFSTGRNNFSI